MAITFKSMSVIAARDRAITLGNIVPRELVQKLNEVLNQSGDGTHFIGKKGKYRFELVLSGDEAKLSISLLGEKRLDLGQVHAYESAQSLGDDKWLVFKPEDASYAKVREKIDDNIANHHKWDDGIDMDR